MSVLMEFNFNRIDDVLYIACKGYIIYGIKLLNLFVLKLRF